MTAPRRNPPRSQTSTTQGPTRGSPRPQRAHRDPVTLPRPAVRRSARHPTYHSGRQLAALATRLTPRDLWLIAMVHEHRVLTTHAIAAMAFDSAPRARQRLLRLYQWDVLDRFAPRLSAGTAPMHYVLGAAGAAVLAAQAGLPARALRYRRDDALAIAHHHTLAHTVAVNDLFAHLVHDTARADHGDDGDHGGPGDHAGRAAQRLRLDCWWSEARCRRHLDYARPDAYGRVTGSRATGGGTTSGPRTTRTGDGGVGSGVVMFEWFLELDFATSTLDTLARKLDRYARLAATAQPRPVLIWLPTPAREAHARRHLARAQQVTDPDLVPVATATAAIATLPRHRHTDLDTEQPVLGPADAVWLPLGPGLQTGRLDLTGLARLWPARPGHTLADDTRPAADDGDTGVAAARDLPAPLPVPPASRSRPVGGGPPRRSPR